MKPGKKGIVRIIEATNYSRKGFAATYKNEAAFRQELLGLLLGVPLALWLARDGVQLLLLVLPLLFLLFAELINSAIEAVVDRIGPEMHELSGRAKDMGSASVFMALVMIALSWTVILLENFGSSWH